MPDGETRGENRRLLVVSDMHLGRDCKEITGFNQAARPDSAFDKAFIDMLDHYTSAREKEWRIIFAGDFVDFVEVVVVPGRKGLLDLRLTFEATVEESTFGLGTEAERSVVKLEHAIKYHISLFRRIAHFVREGGEIVMIRGNHDAEFYWRKVQRVFRRRLAAMAYAGMNLDLDEVIERRAEFQERVVFSPWCYYEEGRVYIEHGHQYDVYCSHEFQLYPVSPTNPRKMDQPLFAFAMRYFVNMLNDYAPENADVWRIRDYYHWLRDKGVGGTIYTTKMAIGAGLRMLQYAWRFAYGRVRRYGKEHKKNLKDEAQRYGVPVEKLASVDALHHTPVNRNLSELMRLLMLDRFLLATGTLTMAMLVLLVIENAWIELAGLVVTGIIAFFVNRKMAPRRFLLPGPKQAQAARKIASVLDVPLVVMGHSHARRVADLGKGRRYMNTGCWLPPHDGKEHVDVQAPCTCKLSHIVVEDEGELRVFCQAAHTVRVADVAVDVPRFGDSTDDLVSTPSG